MSTEIKAVIDRLLETIQAAAHSNELGAWTLQSAAGGHVRTAG
jgi:hypothetical protein